MSILANELDEPITDRMQLVRYFSDAERPQAACLIGCEHEMFPYRLSTLKPIRYDEPNSIREFFAGMSDFGWVPVEEKGIVIGLKRGRCAISMEPGTYLELAAAPLHDLHETAAEIDQFLTESCDVAEKLGMGLLGLGFHPTARREDIFWTPGKPRYEIMRRYMPARGKLGLDMMLRTCALQVSLNYFSEADMVRKFRVGLALQPLATALFASSPFAEGKPNGYMSYRMHVWQATDPDRCGAPNFVFEDGFGYERYVDYALDVPMYFIYRDRQYTDCAGQSFRDFMERKLPALPGETPTLADWANHLTTIFTDVRLKKVLELRGADMGSAEMMLALPSFWTGLLYDSKALDDACDLIKDWTKEERDRLHTNVPRLGFEAEIKGRKLYDVAQDAITLAQQGLRRRAIRLHGGADETRYLDILFNYTESRHSMADKLLMQHNHTSDFSMQKLFDMGRLLPPPKRVTDE